MRTYRTPGFTLIELIVVIVILGILAAVAVPRFVNFRDDAEKAVIEGFVASLNTAHTVAFGKLVFCNHYPWAHPTAWPQGKHWVWLQNFVQYNKHEPSPSNDCNVFFGTSSLRGNTICLEGIRAAVFDDPTVFTDDTLNPSGHYEFGQSIKFVTKTGRNVEILQDQTTGAISWTASPAY